MRVADEADAIDLLVDDPGQEIEQGDAGVVQIVVGPLRRVARDQRPALLDEGVEGDRVEGRAPGSSRAPRRLDGEADVVFLGADEGVRPRRSRSAPPSRAAIATSTTRSTPATAAATRCTSLGHGRRPNGQPIPPAPPSIGWRKSTIALRTSFST